MNRAEFEAAALAMIPEPPFTHDGITYITREEILEAFESRPSDAYEAAHEEALEIEADHQREEEAEREWYREAMAEYEEERSWWGEQYAEDPPTPAEQDLAQDLYAEGYLNDIKLKYPVLSRETGGHYEVRLALPSGERIRDALAARSADLFGDDQSTESAGCSLAVGEVQNGGKVTHLFYDAVMNSIFGDRSAGKTWLALALAREFIERGEHVVWLNFEAMLGSSLRARLTVMGVEQAKVAAYFHVYDRPDGAPSHTLRVGLVVIDAVDPCLSHMGRNTLNDGAAVDEMAKRFFYPYQETNPKVTGLTIDHVGNSNDKRESGSRRKQHYTQGVKYLMASRVKSRKGTKGYSALLLSKDNNGEVPYDDGQEVAYFSLDSTRDSDAISVLIVAAEPLTANESVTEQTERKSARTDALRIIRDAGGVISREDFNAKMKSGLGYTTSNVTTNLNRLKNDHVITVEDNVISMVIAD